MGMVENVELTPDAPAAKVVINARSGTVVIGGIFEQNDSVTDLVRLEPRRDPTPAPLSRNQRAMWVLNQRNTASGAAWRTGTFSMRKCSRASSSVRVSATRKRSVRSSP